MHALHGCTRLRFSAFAAAVQKVPAAAGGGTVHVRGLRTYTLAGVEMLLHVTCRVHAGASVNASLVLAD